MHTVHRIHRLLWFRRSYSITLLMAVPLFLLWMGILVVFSVYYVVCVLRKRHWHQWSAWKQITRHVKKMNFATGGFLEGEQDAQRRECKTCGFVEIKDITCS